MAKSNHLCHTRNWQVLESWGGKRPPQRMLAKVGDLLGTLAAYAADGEFALEPEDILEISDLASRLLSASGAILMDQRVLARLSRSEG